MSLKVMCIPPSKLHECYQDNIVGQLMDWEALEEQKLRNLGAQAFILAPSQLLYIPPLCAHTVYNIGEYSTIIMHTAMLVLIWQW